MDGVMEQEVLAGSKDSQESSATALYSFSLTYLEELARLCLMVFVYMRAAYSVSATRPRCSSAVKANVTPHANRLGGCVACVVQAC